MTVLAHGMRSPVRDNPRDGLARPHHIGLMHVSRGGVNPEDCAIPVSPRFMRGLRCHLDATSSVRVSSEAEKTLVLERPTPDIVARIVAAREAGATRVVCGFLPDEVDWPAGGWSAALAFFVERMEFVPCLLPERAVGGPSGTGFLHVMDRGGGSAPLPDLVEACAAATVREWRVVDVAEVDDEALAAAIHDSAVVFNDVADWSLGFAVDEYAAWIGRRCVRLHNPGYSPLRHALLSQRLIAPGDNNVPRLRSLLVTVLTAGNDQPVACDTRAWFRGPSSVAFWRRLVQSHAVACFLAGRDWKRVTADGLAGGRTWTDRAIAWALLHGASDSGVFPPAAHERAVAQTTDWLVAEMRAHSFGPLQNRALPRWVRCHPAWIERLRPIVGESPDTRAAIGHWITGALLWPAKGTDVAALMAGARWAIGSDGEPPEPWALIFAWWERWSELPKLVEQAAALRPAWRRVFAEVCHATVRGDHDHGSLAHVGQVLSDHRVWETFLGPAGPVLQVLAALRHGRRDIARRVWRQQTPLRGLAGLWRASFAAEGAFLQWLQPTAKLEPNDRSNAAVALVYHWYGRRLWDLRRYHPEGVVRQELSRALELLHALAPEQRAQGAARRLYAGLYSLQGDGAGVLRVIGRPGPGAAGSVDLASVGALTLAVRAQPLAARALLEAWPESEQDSPASMYFRALAWQFLDERDRATINLRRLRECAPDFLRRESGADGRWIWAAVLLRRAGRHDRAAYFHARALAQAEGVRYWIFEETEPCPGALAEGWNELTTMEADSGRVDREAR